MSRSWSLKSQKVGLLTYPETYKDAIKRLTEEDSNAYGQKNRSIATRIKINVNLASDVRTDAGSDMFMLASYLAFSLEKVYAMIADADMSEDMKIKLANQVREIEEAPASFAAARKLQRGNKKPAVPAPKEGFFKKILKKLGKGKHGKENS